jgi:hypothetical protein
MKHSHEYIRERLPDYLSGALSEKEKSEIQRHINECPDCNEELLLIEELHVVDVPDPGEFFWNTLPQKVTAISREQNRKKFSFKYLLRPVPVTAFSLLIAVIAILITYRLNLQGTYYDPLFRYPLSATFIDYSRLNNEDIAEVAEGIVIDDNSLDTLVTENSFGVSYHKDLASLSSEEVYSLYEALDDKKTKGGVL